VGCTRFRFSTVYRRYRRLGVNLAEAIKPGKLAAWLEVIAMTMGLGLFWFFVFCFVVLMGLALFAEVLFYQEEQHDF
jgi:uncharacterized membrane protein